MIKRIVHLLVAVSLLATVGGLKAQDTVRKNVLFVICDDLNCDLGSYGHPLVKSPHIDRLAARGVRFDKAYCQFPVCGPSRASFMTGLYPDQTLIHRNAIFLRETLPSVVTMSQHFIRNGYRATRVGKIYHYNVPSHIGTGGHDDPYSWDQTINPRGRDRDDEPLIRAIKPRKRFGALLSWLPADGADSEQTDAIGASEAIRVMERHAVDKSPFFLAVGLYRPHTPYVAPKKYFKMYPREKIVVPSVPQGYLATLPEPAQKSLLRKKEQLNLDPKLAVQAIQGYYASITFADAQLGRMLDALERLGLEKNTVVVFTSDHGYHMGEHGHYQKTTLFENATRVPLIIAAPGMKSGGKTSKSFAEMIDFYPTLAELCDLPTPQNLSGRSLVPTLKDPGVMTRESAFTQYDVGYSLRIERYRYSAWGEDGKLGVELYDRVSDPDELVNLAGQTQMAETEARLKKLWLQRVELARKVPAKLKQVPRAQ
jgi:arylsulfatase A-like enzyme